MIDHFSIFTTGGIVLWQYTQGKIRSNPINELIRIVLLEVS